MTEHEQQDGRGVTDVRHLLNERGKTYGTFEEQAAVVQHLKQYLRMVLEERRRTLPADMMESLDSICLKISRITYGDPYYADSWDDIAGYATLVSDRLKGVRR